MGYDGGTKQNLAVRFCIRSVDVRKHCRCIEQLIYQSCNYETGILHCVVARCWSSASVATTQAATAAACIRFSLHLAANVSSRHIGKLEQIMLTLQRSLTEATATLIIVTSAAAS